MKKADIISTYNNLLPELEKVVTNYKTVTGQDCSIIMYKPMGPRNMTWAKDELENSLCNLERKIKDIKFNTEVYANTEKMKSTEEGQAFIFHLEDEKAKAENEIHNISDSFHTEFKKLLDSIGMENWILNPNTVFNLSNYNYFSIFNSTNKWCNMHVYIKRDKGIWRFEPSVSIHCGSHEVGDLDEQYLICKGYVTICEHAKEIHVWLNEVFAPLVSKTYDLNMMIDKLDDQLKNPYEAWMEK